MTQQQLSVLHIEDDLLDQKLLAKAVKRLPLQHNLIATTSAQHAIDLLSGQADSAPPTGPTLVLLDLNLPGMSGLDFLTALQARPARKACIVVVLTTSSRPADISAAYANGAAVYITKDAAGDDYEQVAQLIQVLADTCAFPRP